MSRAELKALVIGLVDHRVAAIEERVAALERQTNNLARAAPADGSAEAT